MKKLLTFLLVALSFAAQSQVLTQPTVFGSLYKNLGSKNVMLLPTGSGEPAPLDPKLRTYNQGAIYIDKVGNQIYFWNPDTETWSNVTGAAALQDGRISGAQVTWTGDSTAFFIQAGTFRKFGEFYTTNDTTIILDRPNDLYGRIDKIAFDTSNGGEITKITGELSPTPIEPQVSDYQIELTTGIAFNAGSTTPSNVSVSIIYDENVEYTTGHTGTMTVNFNNTANVYHGSKSAYISSYSKNSALTFGGTATDVTTDGVLSLWINLTGSFSKSFTFQLWNNTTAASNSITVSNTYGFDPNYIGWQNIAIPLSAFSWTSQTFNKATITITGNGSFSGVPPFYLDYLQVQKGLTNSTPPADYSGKLDAIKVTKTTDANDTIHKVIEVAKGIETQVGEIRTPQPITLDAVGVVSLDYIEPRHYQIRVNTSNDSTFENANDSTLPTTDAVKKYVGKNSNIAFVDDIPALISFSGNAPTVIVKDQVRGGTFNYISTGAADNGVVFAATGKGSGYWQRVIGKEVFPEWWGTGTTTSRSYIQSALNYGAGKAIDVVLRYNYNLDSSLIIGSNTTLLLNKTARVNLNDSVSRTMLINRNAIAAGSPNVVDSNIIVSGGTWYGNGLKQNLWSGETGTAVTTVFTFAGVSNLHLSDIEIDSSRAYAMLISSYKNVYCQRLRINNSTTIFDRNLDGIHLNGPGKNAFVNDCTFRGTDDQIALNANDGSYYYILSGGGNIENTIINNSILDSTLKFVRILAANNSVTNTIISNTTGTTIGNIMDMGNYGLGTSGAINGVQVINTNVISKATSGGAANYPIFRLDKGQYNNISIINTIINGTHFANPTIKVFAGATFNGFNIKDFTSISSDTISLSDFQIAAGATTTINNFTIDGYKYKGANKKAGLKVFDFNNLSSNNLSIINSSADSANVSLRITNSTIKNLSLNSNFNVQSDSGTVIKSSTIDSLNLNGTYFKDAANLAFTKDAASTIAGVITPLKLKQSGDVTSSNPVQYKSNGVVYSIGATQITVVPYSSTSAPQINYPGATSTGVFLGTTFLGWSNFGTTKFFFQNATNRGFVLASDLPFAWSTTTDAAGAAPDIYFTRTAAKELTLSSNQSTGIAKLKYAATPTYTASDNLTLVNAGSVPIISSGTAAPTSTPIKAGDIYVDTTNKKLYFAAGNSSSADWIIAN